MMTIRRSVIGGNVGIPPAYTKKTYLQMGSSGTAYIDSGKVVESGSVIEITFYSNTTTGPAFPCLLGWRRNASTNQHCMLLSRKSDSAGMIAIGVGAYSTGNLYAYGNNAKKTVTIDTSAGKVYVDGTEVTLTSNFSLPFGTGGTSEITPALLSMCEWNGSAKTFSNPSYGSRIYGYKVTKNGRTVIDLVPCVRKSDSVAGLYDVIGRRFVVGVGTYTTD